MPLPLPPRDFLDINEQDRLPRGTGLIIAFGIGAVSWAIIVAAAMVLLRH